MPAQGAYLVVMMSTGGSIDRAPLVIRATRRTFGLIVLGASLFTLNGCSTAGAVHGELQSSSEAGVTSSSDRSILEGKSCSKKLKSLYPAATFEIESVDENAVGAKVYGTPSNGTDFTCVVELDDQGLPNVTSLRILDDGHLVTLKIF